MISCLILAFGVVGIITHRPGSWSTARIGVIFAGVAVLAGIAHLLSPEKTKGTRK
jgi:hypothetical protein